MFNTVHPDLPAIVVTNPDYNSNPQNELDRIAVVIGGKLAEILK